jgi:molybdopterin molybdotransferase
VEGSVIDLDEAWALLDRSIEPLGIERVAIDDAVGRWSAEQLRSTLNLPVFDNSAMDGYAVRSSDVQDASDDRPVRLEVVADTFAGEAPAPEVAPKTAVRIMTGAPVPPGADAVLRLEDGRLRGETVEVRAPLPPGRHIRRAAEDLAAGDVVIEPGTRVHAGNVGLLAASGHATMATPRAPRLSLLVTGSELRTPGEPLGAGEIHDSNGPVLRALARTSGYALKDHGIVGDDREELSRRIERAAAESDVLVLSGGVSVGRRDFVKKVVDELGGERLFWRVRMKPGKPVLCARMPGGCIVLGLPGNPVSVLAGWVLFAEPLLRRLSGDRSPFGPRSRPARLETELRGDGSRVVMATARGRYAVEAAAWTVEPTATQGSAMMRSMAEGTCFIRVDPDAVLHPGDLVTTYGYAS